jgi:hypothetical protein
MFLLELVKDTLSNKKVEIEDEKNVAFFVSVWAENCPQAHRDILTKNQMSLVRIPTLLHREKKQAE